MNVENLVSEAGVKQSVTRGQFLSTLGVALVGFVVPTMFLSSKETVVINSSYGNNSYGGKG